MKEQSLVLNIQSKEANNVWHNIHLIQNRTNVKISDVNISRFVTTKSRYTEVYIANHACFCCHKPRITHKSKTLKAISTRLNQPFLYAV